MLEVLEVIVREIREFAWGSARSVGKSLRSNIGLGLLALGLSFGLWLLISVEQNPPRVDIFSPSILVEPVNVPRGLDVLGAVPSVLVRVSAPLDSWDRLTVNTFKATADLTLASAGTYEAPVHVEPNDWRVRVLDVIPSKVTVRLTALTRQIVEVKVNLLGSIPPGYASGNMRVNPERVTVLGPEPLVSQVDVAAADVSLTGATVNISQSLKLRPRTVRGFEIEGVTLEPSSALVEIPITQQILYRTFSISPQMRGEPAPGYWISAISVQPPAVTVTGTRDALQPLAFLETQPVDITGASANIVRTVGLSLPRGVALVGAANVVVYLSVSPIDASRVVRVVPDFRGLAASLSILSSLNAVDVTINGDLPTLRALRPSDIIVTVDLTNLGPGLHEVEPRVNVPRGITLGRVDPERIWVIIR
ncbi:MAG: hypothetical protein HYX92_18645 [Chloroflexi bacterium]|nr:hypothetical protein [Chloroflexota bacterium]